jgi:hypothetical protein
MCRNFCTPTRRATSHITLVPKQLVRTNAYGSLMLRSTWLSAAKCTTMSCPSMLLTTVSSSQMSPWTKVVRVSSRTSRMLSMLPAYVSASKIVISSSLLASSQRT